VATTVWYLVERIAAALRVNSTVQNIVTKMNEKISTPINLNLKRISAQAIFDAPPPPCGLRKTIKTVDSESENNPNYLPIFQSTMAFEVDGVKAHKRLCRRSVTLVSEQAPDFGQHLRFRRTIFEETGNEPRISRLGNTIFVEDLPPLPFPEAPKSHLIEDDPEDS